MFELNGKVAVITGGLSGIGLECAKQLLRNGLKAATLIDINATLEETVIDEITEEFGSGVVLYLQVDVRNKVKFEEAFQTTAAKFGSVDILVNSAGILNEKEWENQVDINLKGTINGTILALETYLPKYRSGEEALIVNISSVTALEEEAALPIYVATKAAVLALSRSLGAATHFERTKVRLISLCIGATITTIANELFQNLLTPDYLDLVIEHSLKYPVQTAEYVGEGFLKTIREGKPGSTWVIEADQTYEIEFEKRIGKPKL